MCVFLIKDNKLLEKDNEIWDNVSNSIKNDLIVTLYKMKNIKKIKIKFYGGNVNTNFHNDKMPKEGSHCICLSVILIDFVFKIGKNYYPQMFLEECKYIVKEKEVTRQITGT